MLSRSVLLLPMLIAVAGMAQTVVMPTVEMPRVEMPRIDLPRVEMPGSSERTIAPGRGGWLYGPGGDVTGTWSSNATGERILIAGPDGSTDRELKPSAASPAIWVPTLGGIERWKLDPVTGTLRKLP